MTGIVTLGRKGWVDALRGLAILLVMYGHCARNSSEFFVFTSPIKMPLFFAISAYVFNVMGGWNDFLCKLVRKVIIPWFILGLLISVPHIPEDGVGYVADYFFRMISGDELWFMPCFAIAQVIQYIIRHYCPKDFLIIIVSVVFLVVGLAAHYKNVLNYAMINRALVVQFFYLIGYLFYQHEKMIVRIKWSWIVLALLLYISLCILGMRMYPGQIIDVHLNRYYNLPYCMALITLGLSVLFVAASKIDFCSKIMSFIGQNTLLMYIWHLSLISIFEKSLSIIGLTLPEVWWSALIKVIWACISCSVLAIFLNRFVPEIVGKKRI